MAVETPHAASLVMPAGFAESDRGFQFAKGAKGDVEITLVIGEDKGALDADADLASTLSTDPAAMARRYDVGSTKGVLEVLPTETDGAGKSWERLHFRVWTDIADGAGVRTIVNFKFPAGTRAAHEQDFADVVATLKIGAKPPAPGVSGSPSASAGR